MPPSPQIKHIRCLDTKKMKDKHSCEMSEKAKSNSKPPARNNVIGKEKIRLVTQDLIRDLIVPKTEPNLYPAVMEKSDLKRLHNQAKVITTKDRLDMLEQAEALKNQEMKESMARKAEIKKYEKQREKGVKLTEVEQEAKRQALHLLQRAFEMRQEQEDEVKKANRLILGTKCHAIRDAQIAEKKLIIKELEEEERRLDQMMEQDRKDALYREEQRREKMKTEKQNYVHYIMEQIKEGEIQKIIEAERIEEECRMINEAQMAMQLDDLKNQKKRVEEQQKMREELRKVNEQLLYFQDLEREEERIADLRVQEYMKQKAKREAAREEELKLQKMAKEREIARLRALQQRQQDLQAEMDELNAQRIQDEYRPKTVCMILARPSFPAVRPVRTDLVEEHGLQRKANFGSRQLALTTLDWVTDHPLRQTGCGSDSPSSSLCSVQRRWLSILGAKAVPPLRTTSSDMVWVLLCHPCIIRTSHATSRHLVLYHCGTSRLARPLSRARVPQSQLDCTRLEFKDLHTGLHSAFTACHLI
uniref:Cilia- and flagella-associated protein 45 n=1 Tax=Timema poppense TaxID=170557 RepID=A0A7R9H1Z1_TIMPO|nr:unnamed protein product [Timema poppensis]